MFGWSGVLRGAAIVFFAYIGFDAISTAAQEATNPRRDMPIGILGSLLICAVLYVLVSVVLTGIVPYDKLDVRRPDRRRHRRHRADVARAACETRRRARPDLGNPGAAARPGAHLLLDVARRTAARLGRADSSAFPYALCELAADCGRGHGARGNIADQHGGTTGFDRDADGVCHRLHRCAGAARATAGYAARVQGAGDLAGRTRRRVERVSADAGAAGRDLAASRDLGRDRTMRLFPLQHAPQPSASSPKRQRNAKPRSPERRHAARPRTSVAEGFSPNASRKYFEKWPRLPKPQANATSVTDVVSSGRDSIMRARCSRTWRRNSIGE